MYAPHQSRFDSRERHVPQKILIVDDQAIARRGLRTVLTQDEAWPVEITEAENGRAGVEKFSKVKPDVVVLDLIMPVMGGLEAAYEIRKLAPDANIIFVSSKYSEEEADTICQIWYQCVC